MYETGSICLKIAGRDAGSYCVVVDEKDDKVLVDGQTRRRYVNPRHLELTGKKATLKKGASHKDVVEALAKEGITVEEPSGRPSAKKAAKASKKGE